MVKPEYFDGTNWKTFATENYINVNNLLSSTTSYTLLTTDATVITNNPSASVGLTLPSSPIIGQQYTIIDGAGVSATYPITITSTNSPVYQTGWTPSFNPSVLSTLTGFSSPFKIAITPNGNYIYIVNNSAGTVSVLQNASSGSPTLLTTINVGSSPTGVAVTPNGNYGYVVNQSNQVYVIQNASTNSPSVLTTLSTGAGSWDVAITPNGNYAYIANRTGGTVTVIQNASSGSPSLLTTLTVGSGSTSIAITPNGNYAYVANYNASTISVFQNASSGSPSLLTTITLTAGNNPYGLAITPNGNYVYVANNNNNVLTVIQNASSGSPTVLSTTLTVGYGAVSVAITPNGNYVYVTNQASNNVTIIQNASSGSPSVLGTTVTVGSGAFGIAITPNGNYAYVTNQGTTTVSLIQNVSGNVSVSAIIAVNYGQIQLIYNGTSWDATLPPSNSGGGSSDTYQTLTFATNVTWNWANGNIATITLTGNTTITPVVGTASKGTLIVKQDSTGSRTLSLPAGLYRTGSTSQIISLSTSANAIDVLNFQKDVNNNLYLWNANYQFVAISSVPTNKFIFVFDGSIKTVTIPVSANNVCRIRMLAGGGGQGIYNGGGSSGAGGFSVYQFSTASYIGQELKLVVAGGGRGGSYAIGPGLGGYPNGGNGISGDTWCGGGGGRSDIRIGPTTQSFSLATLLAISGGGGGGTGYSGYGGAGGGTTGQQSQSTASTAGTQTAGGTSAPTPPSPFQQAGFMQGAGGIGLITGQGYDTGGGGDGYYGGGCSGGDGQASSGGSGYINTGLSGYLSSYSSIPSATYQGNQIAIPTQASSDSEFNDGSGAGRVGIGGGTGVVGMNGGNGKIIVEFL